MGQVLHGSATTTEAIRRAIQRSQESLRGLAKRCGINPKTVAKWKQRGSVADRPTGPRQPRSTILSLEDEAIIVAFRRHTLLPLDDCLYALQGTIPHLTRSSFDLIVVLPPVPEGLIMPEVEELIRASGAELRLGGDKAFNPPALNSPVPSAGELFRADQLASYRPARARPLDQASIAIGARPVRSIRREILCVRRALCVIWTVCTGPPLSSEDLSR